MLVLYRLRMGNTNSNYRVYIYAGPMCTDQEKKDKRGKE